MASLDDEVTTMPNFTVSEWATIHDALVAYFSDKRDAAREDEWVHPEMSRFLIKLSDDAYSLSKLIATQIKDQREAIIWSF